MTEEPAATRRLTGPPVFMKTGTAAKFILQQSLFLSLSLFRFLSILQILSISFISAEYPENLPFRKKTPPALTLFSLLCASDSPGRFWQWESALLHHRTVVFRIGIAFCVKEQNHGILI